MLSDSQIQQLQIHVNNGDALAYYQGLADFGVAYGHLGLGAASDGNSGNPLADFGGTFANNFLEAKFSETHGRAMWESEKQAIREGLITADFALRQTGDVTSSKIQIYHHEVFQSLNIPKEAWTGTFFDTRLGPYSWCWDCGPEELGDANFDKMVDTFVENLVEDFGPTSTELGEFVSDVMLGEVASNTFNEWGLNQSKLAGDVAFADTASPVWATTLYTLERLPTLSAETILTVFEQIFSFNHNISSSINDIFFDAINSFFYRKDPLVLDLDGDGIETIPADGSVLFDHDGDGIKHATGWISPDDGLLVLDRNNNGLIDNGSELFGDNTIKNDGNKALNGFDALIDFDSNGDGLVSDQDALFDELRIWRDYNSDGISQSSELSSLSDTGVKNILLANEDVNIVDENNNQLIAQGQFNFANGAIGMTGAAAALNLTNNTFYREFTDSLPIPSELAHLHNTKGSGAVRDLLEAASISSELSALLTTFSSSTSGTEQNSLMDSILASWADSADFVNSSSLVHNDLNDVELVILASGQSRQIHTNYLINQNFIENDEGSLVGTPEELTEAIEQHQAQLKLARVMNVLEVFNGVTILTETESIFRFDTLAGNTISARNEAGVFNVTEARWRVYLQPSEGSESLFLESYEELRQQIYTDLALQTRLKPYMDDVSFTFDATGLHVDFSALQNRLDSLRQLSPEEAFVDLIDLNRMVGQRYLSVGWDSQSILKAWFTQEESNTSLIEALVVSGYVFDGNDSAGSVGMDIFWGQGDDNSFNGASGDDLLFGNDGNDLFSGGSGNDSLDGGAGDDRLFGDAGDDVLNGGEGSDYLSGKSGNDILRGGTGDGDILTGGTGNDTYLFGAGDGNTTIRNNDNGEDNQDTLRFLEGIEVSDVRATRSGDDLHFTLQSTGEVITVELFFSPLTSDYELASIAFFDGTVWDVDTLKALVMVPTDGDDNITGYATDETIHGLGGNDTLIGGGGDDSVFGDTGNDVVHGLDGNDSLEGGIGDDYLSGGVGDDTVHGGEGDDSLSGNNGDDILTGGTGNDRFSGDKGNDTYVFNLGDGQDTISNYDPNVDSIDTLRFGEGITNNDLLLTPSGNDLLISINGTTDQITLSEHFYGTESLYALDVIEFSDGTVWDSEVIAQVLMMATVNNDVLRGQDSSNDVINGLAGDDTISGQGGNDTLDGGEGNDTLLGNDGDDTLLGGTGNDIAHGQDGDDYLNGGIGDDYLNGGEGHDILNGGVGEDSLIASGGNDILTGGTSNDNLSGGKGNDIYVFNLGDGQDSINNYDSDTGSIDTLRFGEGIAASDLLLTPSGNHLLITISGTTDQITLSEHFYGTDALYAIDVIEFTDGTLWDSAAIAQVLMTGSLNDDVLRGQDSSDDIISGLTGNDNIKGLGGNDILDGGDGNDTLIGGEGNDQLDGGDGVDQIIGGSGDDVLSGGAGDGDQLTGGVGNDVYLFGIGDGNTTIDNYDVTLGRIDVLLFGEGINTEDVLATSSGKDLLLTLKNTSEEITISNYFEGDGAGGYALNVIQFNDGSEWDISTIIELVLAPNEEQNLLLGTNNNDVMTGSELEDLIRSGAGVDRLYGRAGNDVLYGEEGDDYLLGEDDDDQLLGGAGNDNLSGGNGDDILTGGTGNDTLDGGNGSDRFLFNIDDGQDIISHYDSSAAASAIDSIVFGEGIGLDDITLEKSGDHLFIKLVGGEDQLKLNSWFKNDYYQIDQFELSGGIILSNNEFINHFAMNSVGGGTRDTFYGGAGVDIMSGGGGIDRLYGRAGNDVLHGDDDGDYLLGEDDDDQLLGGAGNDNLSGGNGDDILIGGTGNDTLDGGNGSDRFLFNIGDGQDIISHYDSSAAASAIDSIVFGEEIGLDDITLEKSGDHLFIKLAGGEDQLKLNNWFKNDYYQVDQFEFSGGTILSNDEFIGNFAMNSVGSGARNTFYGGAGVDIMSGGGGIDRLYGGAGNDVLHGDDDGDYLLGEDDEDELLGGAGNDNLSGGNGDDILTGGTGNDTLSGDSGSDTYVFNLGDGQDSISNYEANSDIIDTLRFGEGISVSDLVFTPSGNHLLITINGTTDQISLSNHFSGSDGFYAIDSIEFADGSSLTPAEIETAAQTGSAAPSAQAKIINDNNSLTENAWGELSIYMEKIEESETLELDNSDVAFSVVDHSFALLSQTMASIDDHDESEDVSLPTAKHLVKSNIVEHLF